MKATTIRRTITAAILITGLLTLGLPRTSAVQRVALKSDSQIKSEARLYETAILEIGRIENLGLKTADEFNRAKGIIEQHGPNLKFIRAKLVAIALNDSTLISAARARTSSTKLAEELAVELASNAESIFKLSGGATVRDKISRSYANDISLLLRVSEKLKKAASEFKGHHATGTSLPHANLQREAVRTTLATIVIASLIVSAVMIACPPLAIPLAVLATVAVGTIIGATGVAATAALITGAAILLGRIAANAGSEQGRDRVADCIADAQAQQTACANEHPIIAAMGGCLAEYLVRAAICLTIE